MVVLCQGKWSASYVKTKLISKFEKVDMFINSVKTKFATLFTVSGIVIKLGVAVGFNNSNLKLCRI